MQGFLGGHKFRLSIQPYLERCGLLPAHINFVVGGMPEAQFQLSVKMGMDLFDALNGDNILPVQPEEPDRVEGLFQLIQGFVGNVRIFA